MAEVKKKEERGFGNKRGKKDGKGPRRGGDREEWTPCTKLGRLVKTNKIKSLEQVFHYSIPIKESEIVTHFLGEKLKEEAMKIAPVQKQTQAGQRTRFKAVVLVGDNDGHLGLGVKCAKEVQTAIKGGIMAAKLNIVPIRRGYWGNKIGRPHTVPVKMKGKSGSVRIRLVPAPRGTGIVASPTPKKVLQLAGIQDCYTSCEGNTKTQENSLKATYHALSKLYRYLTPDLWGNVPLTLLPFEEFSDFLKARDGKKGE